jgi:hypothetical protein
VSRERKGPRKACCMISEILEESGIDRDKLRRVRRQLLEGIILLCQWQLERMDGGRERPAAAERKGRRINVQ